MHLSMMLHGTLSSPSLTWSTTYPDGSTLAVESIAPSIVRVTTTPFGAPHEPSPINLILPQDSSTAPPLTVTKSATGWHLAAGIAAVDVSSAEPTANISRGDTLLSVELAAPVLITDPNGCGTVNNGGPMRGGRWPDCPNCCLRARRSLQAGEELFGGGVQLSSGPGMRGSNLFLKTNAMAETHSGWSHVVAPFFMSSLQFGVFANTHRYSYWEIGTAPPPPPPPGLVCDEKWADPASGFNTSDLTLVCPPGHTIDNITFAEYGLPSGSCGYWTPSKSCGINVRPQLTAACIGKAGCSIKIGNLWAGGDPCIGNNQKHVAAEATCSPPSESSVGSSGGGSSGAEYASETAIHLADPVVDLFFFIGPTHHDVLAQYTKLTGRMTQPPKWAMGQWYHPQENSNQTTVLAIADHFISSGAPLAALTLEPPWQTHAYACTYVWNTATMFPDPATFVIDLQRRNVSLTLWEHAYVANETKIDKPSPLYQPLLDEHCVADWLSFGGLTPDFTMNATRTIFQKYHTKTFIDIGVAGFKLDECDGNPGKTDPGSGTKKRWFFPDNATFPSGLSGAEMHNMFGELYGATFHEMFHQAGLRTFLKARAMYVGGTGHPTTFYSDTYTLSNYLRGVVNSGFGGWVWAPEVRDAQNDDDFARRSQLMLFSALSSMDGWNSGFTPFVPFVSNASAAMFVSLSAVRAQLETFLFTAFQRQVTDGIPVIRHCLLDYGLESKTLVGVDDQYLLGDGLLVAPVITTNATKRVVVFPGGGQSRNGNDMWHSYWNHSAVFVGGTTVTVHAPQKLVPLFQRAGSILPLLRTREQGVYSSASVREGGADFTNALVLRLADSGKLFVSIEVSLYQHINNLLLIYYLSFAGGIASTSYVYDDDGKTTRATTHGERFRMSLRSEYTQNTAVRRLLYISARVETMGWTPTSWSGTLLRWEIIEHSNSANDAAAASEAWSLVMCNDVAVQSFASERELSASGAEYGWAALTSDEIETQAAKPYGRAAPRYILHTPLLASRGWQLNCTVVRRD